MGVRGGAEVPGLKEATNRLAIFKAVSLMLKDNHACRKAQRAGLACPWGLD